MLCRDLDYDAPVSGWLASEKFDGVRAIWDGENLVSRTGKSFQAPAEFLASLPAGIVLDGELWAGRGRFQQVLSAVRSGKFDGLRFVVFDAPTHFGDFARRLAWLRETVPSLVCDFTEARDYAHARQFARDIFHGGGEGIVARDPRGLYKPGPSHAMLRFKCGRGSFEAVVENVTQTKVQARAGGVLLRLANNRIAPTVGQTVTINHIGWTDDGLPRHATIVAVRDYE